jgi:hypothetical protein
MSTDIGAYIAVAILTGVPFLGLVICRRGAAALFASPRSRVAATILASIIFANLVVALGVLAAGGWWYSLVPWCGFLLFVYLWIRGAYLLLHLPPEQDTKGGKTANTA